MCPAIVPGIVTGDALVSNWPNVFPVVELQTSLETCFNLAQIIIVSNVASC